jgi:hypothetical protein
VIILCLADNRDGKSWVNINVVVGTLMKSYCSFDSTVESSNFCHL